MKDSTCVECGAMFTPTHVREVACSPRCKHERHKQISRNHAAHKYQQRKPAPRACVRCSTIFTPTKRSDAKYCTDLCQQRARQDRQRTTHRVEERRCHKCGVPVEWKPGKPVCADCRIDKRDPVKSAAKERRRRLRKYGLTEAEYNAILEHQGHRCGICATDTPGAKGWVIDHCHDSGMVRGVLCSQCNSAIGLLREDPVIIDRAAEYVREHTQLRLFVASGGHRAPSTP